MGFATGAMGTLLPKLGEMLKEEYNLQKSVKEGIEDLMEELGSMQAALVKVSSVPLDQLDPQIKIWANNVRELSYAIEDNIDSFMIRVEDVDPTKPKFKDFLATALKKLKKFKARHEIGITVKDIEDQVREIWAQYDRYKIHDVVASHATTTVDPRLSALYNKVSDLVGIAKPIDELMKVLSKGGDMSKDNLNIVSIVGFGGLGKTTLAKALYDKLRKSYQCHGFVPVGQNPNTKKVLRDILLELDKALYRDAATMDERQLINQIQQFLEGKRYFIVIDDVWNVPTWETIKFAFMDSHPESRIIITTRIVEVATNAGGIYRMEPLSDCSSKMLFYKRICGDDRIARDNQPLEVANEILKKCGGVPLAIITIASLLVGKRIEDWSRVYKAIGFGKEDSEVVLNTRKILSFSYYDLPPNLKNCLLYLSMFPEDNYIEKKSLIWRWVSEGFVPRKNGIDSFKEGEVYFNVLVNKSLIRWLEPDEFNETLGGCMVHDMVLDLILTISNDLNFVTIHDFDQNATCLQGKQKTRVHRLALHRGSVEHKCSIEMEHVRSFHAITNSDRTMLHLLSCKVLRVLVIRDCFFLEGDHCLEHLGKLVQLRYLGVVNTPAGNLPEGIGHDLKFLEILDIRGAFIDELPSSVGELKNLRCLWVDSSIMKGEVGKLTCLEELQLYLVDKCPNFFTDLGKLTRLRVLEISFNEMEETSARALVDSLSKLHMIESLKIRSNIEHFPFTAGNMEIPAPSSKFHSLSLVNIVISRMPSWINSSRVPLLSKLWLQLDVLESEDFCILGKLPSLLILNLLSKQDKYISYIIGSDEFRKLRSLTMNKEITIREGALPMLEKLKYNASVGRRGVANLVPWNNSCHLVLLTDVTCKLDCADCSNEEVLAAQKVLTAAANTHPNRPILYIELRNQDEEAGRLMFNLQADNDIATSSGVNQDGERVNLQSHCFASFIHAIKSCLIGS